MISNYDDHGASEDAKDSRIRDLEQYEAAVQEAHGRLDKASIPSASRVPCSDPACDTQLGHRVGVALGRISDLEARLAACVGALENIEALICDKPLCGHFTAEEIRAECATCLAYSSPDLAPWRELIGAVRTFTTFVALPENFECEISLSLALQIKTLLDAARRCGLGAER